MGTNQTDKAAEAAPRFQLSRGRLSLKHFHIFCAVFAQLAAAPSPCLAGTPDGMAVIDQLLTRGIVADKGYGYFAWGDLPAGQQDVFCTSEYDDIGMPLTSVCKATTGLPDIGAFRALSATYKFKLAALEIITVEIEIPSDIQTGGELPDSVTLVKGPVEIHFNVQADKTLATVTMINTDPQGKKKAVKEAQKTASEGVVFRDVTPDQAFYSALGVICSPCVRVIRDYASILGATDDFNYRTAVQLLQNSPVISYLFSAETLGKDPKYKFLYDVTLDKLRISSTKTTIPPGEVLQFCTQKAAAATDIH